MKNHFLFTLLAAVTILGACSHKETKTLYGSWEPILEAADTSDKWDVTDANFIIAVTGSCEKIEVGRTQKGDLTNPEVPMLGATCSGDRDILTFSDSTLGNPMVYVLKMDASKDTLIGTSTKVYDNAGKVTVKMKFARI